MCTCDIQNYMFMCQGCLRILIDSKACVSPGENHLSYTHILILLTFLEGHHIVY